jgi:hypothetical protein
MITLSELSLWNQRPGWQHREDGIQTYDLRRIPVRGSRNIVQYKVGLSDTRNFAAILTTGVSPGFQLFGFLALQKLFPNIEDECKKFDIQ